MNKIFFCDIDDTLVGKDKIISDKNQSINKWLDDKNLFVLTSGRGVVGIENFVKDYDFSKYYIACNGAIIYDKLNSRVLHNDYIPKNLVKLLYDYGIENNITVYVHSMYTTKTALIDEDIYQVTYILEEPFKKESLDKVRKFVNNYKEVQIIHDYHNQYKNYYLFDINLKNNSKGLAIKRLLEYLNIDKSNSFAIGNGNNDISMTYYVDKKVVLKTVSSSNNDGVSEAIDILMGGEYE